MHQAGYGEFQVTHSKGERADCFRMYLEPVMGRSNLTVLTGAKTLKIETERAGGATVSRGVTFQLNGQDGSKHSGECGNLNILGAATVIKHTPHLCIPSAKKNK